MDVSLTSLALTFYWIWCTILYSYLAYTFVRALRRASWLTRYRNEITTLRTHFERNVPSGWIFFDGQGH